ncbi:hypothetical protein HRR83_000655 [Exophiala dermatitidis]|uniref:Uncharacterized protein n=1 Tax=Exophiala dermatitidis TaxID=5970 RepID=A0AAN6F1T7_EXODE|nr:hypothetical protein HRR74_000658 [Exophiala dermatitidis]KAJ4528537.1 hypothetical protein HRR73_001160 [Exophiala dermatitidis]KAJ4529908.1 hypothetical protein HRR76_009156 [Exophiala dermatitidis]KAJ4558669.1 hypothetical protein HRR77_000656 [Exophiala dermatitidis]KAJ4581300.1 hypothetical protein HRR79_000342 [Exophiala dermatitidis]
MQKATTGALPPGSDANALSAPGHRGSSLTSQAPQQPLREIDNVNETTPASSSLVKTEPGQFQDSPGEQAEKPRLTIRQIREAAQLKIQAQAQAKQESQNNVATPPSQKKKPSILGGLFQVREPTQVALNQVAAQMVAQHGSISPTKVPNVRLEKMPEFVPKVTSKWDGIPEGVKQRQKKEKEMEKGKAKTSRRDASSSTDPRTTSREGKDGERGSLASRQSSSTTDSMRSRGRSSGSHTASTRNRFYVPSANSSGDLASQQRKDRSLAGKDPLRSVSAGNPPKFSLPEVLPEIPNLPLDASVTLSGPSGPSARFAGDKNGESTMDDETTFNELPWVQPEMIPATAEEQRNADSTISSSRERSPITQGIDAVVGMSGNSGPSNETPILLSSGPGVRGPPAARKPDSSRLTAASCLVGEGRGAYHPSDDASPVETESSGTNQRHGRPDPSILSPIAPSKRREVERRPGSSRTRLGPRANKVVKEEVTPWEVQDLEPPPVQSQPKPAVAASQRTAPASRSKLPKPLSFFTKDKGKNKS